LSKSRELIIAPKCSQAQLVKLLPQLEEEGIKTLYIDPKKISKKLRFKQFIHIIMQIMWF